MFGLVETKEKEPDDILKSLGRNAIWSVCFTSSTKEDHARTRNDFIIQFLESSSSMSAASPSALPIYDIVLNGDPAARAPARAKHK